MLTWYTCGPTVYDHSHVGHARAYVALDIVRRVLNRKGYSVFQVMGVTDIDDKIIAKSKQEGGSGKEGAAAIASTYEQGFFNDMAELDVLPPDAITRVTDFLPDIISFIRGLQDKGFAYVGEQSNTVWFDTKAYGPRYGALEPSRGFNCGHDHDEGWEGEGEVKKMAGEKRNVRDFALWKPVIATDEAGWDSEFGFGRPGWHVECSAFCLAMFGSQPPAPYLHSGGRDLRFPHHENEIAQSQALLESDRWVQHWMHAGQLTVEGKKMSKSLKNFTSIQEFLSTASARQFRIFCLLHRYSADVAFNADRMSDAAAWEKTLANFFRTVGVHSEGTYAAYAASNLAGGGPLRWDAALSELNGRFREAKWDIEQALEDDIDTAAAMRHLRKLTAATQSLITAGSSPSSATWPLVTNIASYVAETLQMLGVDCSDWLQRGSSSLKGHAASAKGQGQAADGPPASEVLEALLDIRQHVREQAVARRKLPGGKDEALVGELLKLCDSIRDELLPQLGVQVHDAKAGGKGQENTPRRWSYDASLRKEKSA